MIEAITEDLGLKIEMWKTLDNIVKKQALFATNTSSLTVVDQAAATERPEHVLGLHFFNPAQVMPLLEVVQAITTSTGTLEAGFEFGKSLKKTVVHARDKPGFIVNRLLIPYLFDAIRAYEEGFGSIERDRHRHEGRRLPPDGAVRRCSTSSASTPATRSGDVMFDEFREKRVAPPPPCASWSRPDSWGARRAAGSTITRVRAGAAGPAARTD